MSNALNDIRVIELGRGPAIGLAAMILADFGAQVIRVKTEHNDFFEHMPAARLWGRGKMTHNLTLPKQIHELDALCASADVFITNHSTSHLEHLGVDLEALRERLPALTTCSIAGFGTRGPLAGLPGSEHLVAAACGRMMTFQGVVDRTGPVFSALQVGIHATAQSAASGILAALWQRQSTHQGSHVETSLLQGMLPFEQGAMVARQFPERFSKPLPTVTPPTAPIPTLFYHPAQTADGSWMQFGNLLPHLFDNFLMVTDLIDVLADPDFDAKQLRLPDPKQEQFRARMLSRIQEKSADEWMSLCTDNGGVVAGKYQTTQQALNDPDIVANGHVIDANDGSKQLGPLARMTKTPAQPGRVYDAQSTVATWLASPRSQPNVRTPTTNAPLQGVRVLELATIIAAPLGASFLADLGAEVIKVEQIGGDPYRGFSFGAGSARVNAGKRSISLNLKSATGQEVVTRLAAQADILIHNYRPGVPEKLGFSYEQMKAINPNLVYLQCNGYGPDGPGAYRPCTHPIPGAAMGGVLFQMGHRVPTVQQDFAQLQQWTSKLMRANEVNPDPNTALVVATTALLGLNARSELGCGQQILVDMFGANAYANHDDFINYADKPARLLPDEGLHGLSAWYRLYPCAEDQWLFLAVPQEHEQKRLFQHLSTLKADQSVLAALGQSQADIAAALEKLFLTQTADAWETELVSAGIGAVRADRYDPADYWLESPQAEEMQLTAPAEHPTWGAYQRHGANVTLNGLRPALRAAPLGGQHSREILLELNYSEDQIDAAFNDGIVWSESI